MLVHCGLNLLSIFELAVDVIMEGSTGLYQLKISEERPFIFSSSLMALHEESAQGRMST